MAIDQEQRKLAETILGILNLPTREDLQAAIRSVVDAVTLATKTLNAKIDARLAQIRNGNDGRDGKPGRDGKDGKDGRDGRDGADGVDGKDADPVDHEAVITRIEQDIPRLGEPIRDALELLRDDNRLDASAIKNLPEGKTEVHHHGGATALFALSDVSLAGILPGQSITWNGTYWEAYTPAGGTGATPVYGEVLQIQNTTGSVFTLADTPSAGSVRLFRGGAYQSVTNGDYSIIGGTITLSSTLQDGETLVADYTPA